MPKQAISEQELAKTQEQSSSSKKTTNSDRKAYKPSSWATGRIDAIPQAIKNDVKRIYGLDIDELVKSADRYGVVEGIAGNNFTQHPVHLTIDRRELLKKEILDKTASQNGDKDKAMAALAWLPELGKEQGWYTIRFWMMPGSEKWGIETHEAKLGIALDESGESVKKEGGLDKMTWDRQELSENTSIRYRGKYFTKDQMDHLRLTGTLGEPFESSNTAGEKAPVNIYLDEYNNTEVVTNPVNFTKLQLESKLKGKNNTFMLDNKVFWIEDESVRVAASGGYVWAFGMNPDPEDSKKMIVDKGDAINVWFDPRTRNFRPTIASNPRIDFEQARREEIRLNQERSNQQGTSQAKTRSQSQSGGRKLGK